MVLRALDFEALGVEPAPRSEAALGFEPSLGSAAPPRFMPAADLDAGVGFEVVPARTGMP